MRTSLRQISLQTFHNCIFYFFQNFNELKLPYPFGLSLLNLYSGLIKYCTYFVLYLKEATHVNLNLHPGYNEGRP